MTKTKLLTQVWKAFRQLNPQNVRVESERPIRMAVIAEEELLGAASQYLLGPDPAAYVCIGDCLLLLPIPIQEGARNILRGMDLVLRQTSYTHPISGISPDRVFTFATAADLPEVARQIARDPRISGLRLALASNFPGLRSEIGQSIIHTVGIENAVFVASTSLGNIIPNPLQPLTSVAATLGDLVVLTANQIRMAFQLSAAYGRKMGFKEQSPEIASIVGAAFGWRAIARELIAMVPLGGGVIPKAAIAYAGTLAVGDGIVFYYKTGRKMTPAQMKQRFNEAMGKARQTVESALKKKS